jgi:subtilisin family serine protease
MPYLDLAELSGQGLDLEARGRPLRSWPAVVAKTADPPPDAVSLGGDYYRVPTDTPLETARQLLADGAIDAFPDLVRNPVPRWNDPEYGGQWYLDSLGMEALYAKSHGDAAVRLAVVDSGIDIDHVDLADKVSDPYDAWSEDEDPSPDPGEYCGKDTDAICDEHGTAVSGIATAIGDNGAGMVGMCPDCTLVPIKLLGEGAGSASAEVSAYQHAIDVDAWVINNSWGFTEYTPAPRILSNLIEEVATENRGGLGAVVVFAAGNDNRELLDDEMEALPTVLCVSATDTYGNASNYTNYGGPVDVAAPSATVSIGPDDTEVTNFGGTSAAAPVVSGLAGWILSVKPDMSAEEVRELIVETAVQSPLVVPDEDGHSSYYGYGIISPENILATLYPEEPEGETPNACGCAETKSPAWLGLLALLGLRRRR